MSNRLERPLVGVGVVFIRNNTIFLAKRLGAHGEDTWGSAGGHLEFGETLEDCARREAMEELGVQVKEVTFLCISNIVAYDKHYVDIEFLGDIDDQSPSVIEHDSFTEYGWYPLNDLPEPLFEPIRYAIDSIRTGLIYYGNH
jgi:8-oxo-dGTP diphosphatase